MRKFRYWSLVIALVATLGASAAPRLLLYMLDGARADVLEHVDHPVWQALKENRWAPGYRAAWSVTAVNEPYTLPASAANHTTIATGKLAKNHHVYDKKGVFFAPFRQSATPTVLERIGRKYPKLKTVQAFSWRPDLGLMAESGNCSIVCGNDVNNNLVLVELLKRPDAPAALMVFDDAPDAGGHHSGFYPYGKQYPVLVAEAMTRFGNLLDAIKARPGFADEDWLIVLCSDHGGCGTGHGFSGGQCHTVPLMYCGRKIPGGRIAGRPGNVGIAANVLRHFGLADEVAELDDAGEFAVAPPETARPVTAGLLYDVAVEDGRIVNRAPGAEKNGVTVHGKLDVGADSFRNAPGGYLTLDGLKNFAGRAFTFAITLKCDLSGIKGDPVIFSNKDWQSGANPGFALAARNDRITFNAACTNAPTDYVVTSPRRMDLFRILMDGKLDRNLIAVSVDPEGLVTVFQKCPNGRCYWFCVGGRGINTTTMRDWNVGQDATGKYKYTAEIEVSGVRVWDRALTLDELRKLELR